jgi:hypothetical protein
VVERVGVLSPSTTKEMDRLKTPIEHVLEAGDVHRQRQISALVPSIGFESVH